MQSFLDSHLQCNGLLYKEGDISFISCGILSVPGTTCEISEVMTHLLLSSVRIFSWPQTSSMPSGWLWHTHHTSSLSSLLTKIAVERDKRVGLSFYRKRKICVSFNNFPVHFTLDPNWCFQLNPGICDQNVKVNFSGRIV